MAGQVIDRARQPFPKEPVRALDALHLSSALVARAAIPDVVVLSLGAIVRENARALGFDLVPAERQEDAPPASPSSPEQN
jgi:hypothetical protein